MPSSHFWAAILNVRLNHKALYQSAYIRRVAHGVEHLIGNTHLLQVLLGGIGVVGVNKHRRVGNAALHIQIMENTQILVMIIGVVDAVAVHTAPQNGVGQRGCPGSLPPSRDK